MAFSQSPAVTTTERDLTLFVAGPSTTTGAFAGPFLWGPVGQRVTLGSERDLYDTFGGPAPSNTNNLGQAEQWLSLASFLAYSGSAQVVRCVGATARNSQADSTGDANTSATILVKDEDDFTAKLANGYFTASDSVFVAAYPGSPGDSIGVSVCTANSQFSSVLTQNADFVITGIELPFTVTGDGTTTITLSSSATGILTTGDILTISGVGARTITGVSGTSVTVNTSVASSISTASITGVTTTDKEIKWSAVEPATSDTTTTIRAVPVKLADYITTSSVITPSGTSTLSIAVGDYVEFSSASTGIVPSNRFVVETVGTFSFTVSPKFTKAVLRNNAFRGATATRYWKYASRFTGAPGTSAFATDATAQNDEVHVIVYDSFGRWSGVVGTVLETYPFVSQAKNARKLDGTSNYLVDVINETSKYIWVIPENLQNVSGFNLLGTTIGIGGTLAADFTDGEDGSRASFVLGHGNDDNAGSDGSDADMLSARIDGYRQFADSESVDVSLIFVGNANATLIQDVIDNVAIARADVVSFFSPQESDTVNTRDANTALKNVVDFKNSIGRSTSYAFMDSGHKYMYDKYNDVYRWVPLNGDMAGLCAYTDLVQDAWFSPAGFNRGNVRNVVRLSWNPNKAQRDVLFSNQINPVSTFQGDGTVLFGDTTLQAKPSAFQFVNVRRLFNVLKKSISRSSKYQLFEQNDAFTRSRWKGLVEPFLKDVRGRRGLSNFSVVCDERNNPLAVTQRGDFVGDIYITPINSIRSMQLNFIAAGGTISFSEIGG